MLQSNLQKIHIEILKSLTMLNFSKSRQSRLDFEKIDTKEFTTVCSWLRDIHGQNIRLLNLMKIIQNELTDDSVLDRPPEE